MFKRVERVEKRLSGNSFAFYENHVVGKPQAVPKDTLYPLALDQIVQTLFEKLYINADSHYA